MMMERWNPFAELRRLEREMGRRFGAGSPTLPEGDFEGWAIPMDLLEEDNNVVVRASLPGVKPEEINVTVEDNLLTIKAETRTETEKKEGKYLMRECRSGSWHRMLRLPDAVDADKAATNYENGVLTITLPKTEAKKAKRLTVAPTNEEKK